MKPRVLKVVTGVNMGMEHAGLSSLLLKEAKINLHTLKEDEVVLCVNSSCTAAKMIGGGGTVIGYLRMPYGGKLKIHALRFISDAFGGTGFQFGNEVRAALSQVLEDESGKLREA